MASNSVVSRRDVIAKRSERIGNSFGSSGP
jgi:hypothetical protein